MRSFYSSSTGKPTDLLNYYLALSQNSSQANIDIGSSMINDEHRKLLQDYFFNENEFAITTVAGQEGYYLPYNYSKLKTGTLTIGNLRWNPTEILSRRDWDNIKTIENYQSDIPNNFFIYNGKFNLWPIPSTTGNTIKFHYKIRVPDLTFTDYTTGTVAATNTQGVQATNQLYGGSTGYVSTIGVATTGGTGTGCTVNTTCVGGVVTSIAINAAGTGYSIGDTLTITGGDGTATFYVSNTVQSTTITGSGTGWLANYLTVAGSVLNLNLWLRITAPAGDGNWYQISSIQSATSLTLVNPYQGGTVTGASYTIGQMPLLLEDFHNLVVYQPLITYFSSINPNEAKAGEFKNLRAQGIEMLDEYCGTKSLNVNLARPPVGENPNLYQSNFGNLPTN
jgi:hypothetical protein